MKNSTSLKSLSSFMDDESSDSFKSEISRQRVSRTLSLRQNSRKILQSKSQTIQSQNSLTSSHEQLMDPSSFPFLDNDYLLSLLDQGNVSQFAQILLQIQAQCSISPRILKTMFNNEAFFDHLNVLFQNFIQTNNFPIVVQIINFIGLIFPVVLPRVQLYIIDNIIFFSLSDLITSTESLTVVTNAINLSAIISTHSSYARDMVLCSGIHSFIICIGREADLDSELLENVCQTLLAIFGNPTPIESNDLLIESIHPLYNLLEHCLSLKQIIESHPDSFSSPPIKKIDKAEENSIPTIDWNSLNESGVSNLSAGSKIIDCYVEITNKDPSIVYNIFDEKISMLVVSFLDDESMVLTPAALRLVGNLSVSIKHQVQECLIRSGLLPKLLNLISSPLAVDAFWCFSNLLESTTSSILPLFQDQTEFISKIIEIATDSSIDVKREASYFLSSLIIFSPTSFLPAFLGKPDLIDILVEMLGCGVVKTIVRCFDCLKKLLLFCQTNISRNGSSSESINSKSYSSDSLFSLENSELNGNEVGGKFSSFISSIFESDLRDRISTIMEDQTDKIVRERALIVEKILDEIQEYLDKSSAI